MSQQPIDPRYSLVYDAHGADEPYALIDTHAPDLDSRYVDTFESEEQAQSEYPELFPCETEA